MTLDEAITHCEETATEKEAMAEFYKAFDMDPNMVKKSITECQDCAKEHRQLAEWLRELGQYWKRNTREPVYSYAPGTAECPACGQMFFEEDNAWKLDYCFRCGQKLQWQAVEKWETKPKEQKG
jgi:hypothetical protein